jgi:hypothetical protein
MSNGRRKKKRKEVVNNMSGVDIRLNNHADDIRDELDTKIERALEAIGLQAEKHAKEKCPVDTGLLRNSITHVVGGNSISGSYHASYGSNRNAKGNRIRATAKNAGSVGFGSYNGSIGEKGDKSVYIGTATSYAPYVEYGHTAANGTYVPPKPFLKPAVMDHIDEYKRLAEAAMKWD